MINTLVVIYKYSIRKIIKLKINREEPNKITMTFT